MSSNLKVLESLRSLRCLRFRGSCPTELASGGHAAGGRHCGVCWFGLAG